MPASDSPAVLVARFLRANHYHETLDAFLNEAGLPEDAATTAKGDITIEKILEEKKAFDLSVQFEKLGTEDGDRGWNTTEAPTKPTTLTTLPTSSNLLHISLEKLVGSKDGDDMRAYLLATTADRRLNILDLPSCNLVASETALHDSPILTVTALDDRHILTTSMSGHILLSDLSGKVYTKRRDHLKYVVRVAVHHTPDTTWVATAGWDGKVHLYKVTSSSTSNPTLGEPIATITLPSNPETLVFLTHPETSDTILLLTRRDSTFLHYYSVSASARLLSRQNLAPHSNAWVAFTPSAAALCPTDPTLLAVATSAVPHMKLLIVRLLIPSADAPEEVAFPVTDIPVTQPSLPEGAPSPATLDARRQLALQDRDAEAIRIHCSTLSPQTPYSTPALAWRPDGSGVWVNSDDGAIRGIEATTGKIVATLKGHDPNTKVRCLWAGWVDSADADGRKEEWLVSGGFDQKLIVWKTAGAGGERPSAESP